MDQGKERPSQKEIANLIAKGQIEGVKITEKATIGRGVKIVFTTTKAEADPAKDTIDRRQAQKEVGITKECNIEA